MAKISKADLMFLSSEQIKTFFKRELTTQSDISPIKELLEKSENTYDLFTKISRVERLLQNIILERFINGTL